MAAARRRYHDRHRRLPPPSYQHNHRAVIARLHAALTLACQAGQPWWRSPVWDPRHDRRIPVRAHEPLEGQRLNFARVSPAWLREAIQWYFAAGLSTGLLSWSSLPGFLSYLGRHFAAFLAAEGIGTPVLDADPEAGIRPVALRLAAWLRQQRTCSGRPLAPLHHRADPDHGGRVLRLHGRPARRRGPGTGRAAVGRADRCPRPLVAARRDRRPLPRPGRGQLHRRGGPVPHRRARRDPRAAPRPGQDRGGERDAAPDPGAGRRAGDAGVPARDRDRTADQRDLDDGLRAAVTGPRPGRQPGRARRRPGRAAALPADQDRRRAAGHPGRRRRGGHRDRAAGLRPRPGAGRRSRRRRPAVSVPGLAGQHRRASATTARTP